jgi:hypothetical protein
VHFGQDFKKADKLKFNTCPDPDPDHRDYTLQGHSCFFFHMKKKVPDQT